MSAAAASTSLRLLDACLPLIPAYGFSRACLLEASHTSLQRSLSPQTLDGLFPSSAGHDGPSHAVLLHWLAQQRSLSLQMVSDKQWTGPTGLVQAMDHRLHLNEPLRDRLKAAWSHRGLSRQIPDLRGLLKHANGTTTAIADAAFAGTQLNRPSSNHKARLGAIYAAAEWHQFSDASPNSQVTHQLMHNLLAKDHSVSQTAAEVGLFGSHVLKTWQGIFKSTYL